jgi:hypothetical protein
LMTQKELNMRQRCLVELIKDYDCDRLPSGKKLMLLQIPLVARIKL